MKTKELITSYDETNDILAGKIIDKNGFIANYTIGNGIFLNTDENNKPISFFIGDASKALNVEKEVLEDPNVAVVIDTDDSQIDFEIYVSSNKIFKLKSDNRFGFEISEIWNTN
ncbi:hypothetical protein [Methanobrevibacter sp.]|uniref:hypothetical protein n=1 Tax=Methanobrevibacter sp. TaxID=66852 RepID=UPI00388F6881